MLEMLDKTFQTELCTNMKDCNANPRMQNLISSYHIILHPNCLGCIVKDSQNVSVAHVLSAIRPQTVNDRLKSDF